MLLPILLFSVGMAQAAKDVNVRINQSEAEIELNADATLNDLITAIDATDWKLEYHLSGITWREAQFYDGAGERNITYLDGFKLSDFIDFNDVSIENGASLALDPSKFSGKVKVNKGFLGGYDDVTANYSYKSSSVITLKVAAPALPKLTVTLQPISYPYDGTVHPVTGKNLVCTDADDNVVTSPTVSLSYNDLFDFNGAGVSSNAGEYTYALTKEGKKKIADLLPAYSVEFTATAAYTITKKPISLVFDDLTGTYGNKDGNNPTTINYSNVKLAAGSALAGDETIKGLIDNDATFAITSAALENPFEDVNTYKYYFATNEVAKAFNEYFFNYTIVYDADQVLGNYIFGQEEALLTICNVLKTYGEATPQILYILKVNGKEYTFNYNAEGFDAADKRTDDENKHINGFKFDVRPALPLLIKQGAEEISENEKIEVGTYDLVVNNVPTAKNYKIKVQNGKLEVIKRDLNFAKLFVERKYYGDEPSGDKYVWLINAAAGAEAGLTSFDVVGLNTRTIDGVTYYELDTKLIDKMPIVSLGDAGENSLPAGKHTDKSLFVINENGYMDANYKVIASDLFGPQGNDGYHYFNIQMTVGKAPLTITLKPIQITYGDEDPKLNDPEFQTTFITYDGFKFNEGEVFAKDEFIEFGVDRIDNLSIANRDKYDAVYLPVGEYGINGVPTEIIADNYLITIVKDGFKLNVVQRIGDTRIEWNPANTSLIKGNVVQLSAQAFVKDFPIDAPVKFRANTSKDTAEMKIHQADGKWYAHVYEIPKGRKLDITAFIEGNDNYDAAEKTINFDVNGRMNDVDMEIEIKNMEFVFDGTPKPVEFKLSDPNGNYDLETAYIQYNSAYGNVPVDAGVYTYSIICRKKGSESDMVVHSENMRIDPAVVTVTATVEKASVVYGAAQPEIGWEADGLCGTDKFYYNDAPSVKLNKTFGDADTYQVIVTGPATLDGNYVINYVNTELVVEKSPLILMAKPEKSTYGDPVPAFQVTTFESDFVKGEGFANLAYQYAVKAVGVTEKPNAGTYILQVTGLSKYDKNYAISYKDTTYVVGQAETVITLGDNPITMNIGDVIDYQFETNNNAGEIEVTFTSIPNGVVKIEKVKGVWTVEALAVGQATLVVEQKSSTNYKAGKSIQYTITVVNDATGIEDAEVKALELYPTYVENFVTLNAPAAVKSVFVVDLTGKTNLTINNPSSQLDLSKLNRGHHIVVVTLEDGTKHTVRILKK